LVEKRIEGAHVWRIGNFLILLNGRG